MNKNKNLAKLLCTSMMIGNITPAFATVMNETNTYDDTTEKVTKETEVLYQKAGNYFVTIPKTISLGVDKQSPYSVKVEGDIPSDKQVYVSPIDGIKDTEVFDFYMHDTNTANPKADVVATVTQNKFYWNFSEVANGYAETDNKVTAEDLTSGTWKGTFDFEINMKAVNGDESHTHSYIETIIKEPTCTENGEKKLTCSCGDTKTETIPATGHNIIDGSCTDCDVIVKTIDDLMVGGDLSFDIGTVLAVDKTDTLKVNNIVIPEQNFTFDKEGDYQVTVETTDPDTNAPIIININITIIINQGSEHTHSYTETIIKDATCTESGEKNLTCSCGDTKTESIPATGHNYGADDKCTNCGELNPNHKHNYTETVIKEASCTESGEKQLTCSCGDTKTESIPATGHNYEDGTCKNCGEAEQCNHNYVTKTYNADWIRDYDGVNGYKWEYASATANSTRYRSNEPTGMVIQNGNPDTGTNAAVTIWKITVPVSCTTQIGFKPQATTGNPRTFIYLNDKEVWNNTNNSLSSLEYKYKNLTLQPGDNYIKATGYQGDCIELFKVSGEYLECSNCSDVLQNNWRYMLDETDKTITLRSYLGSDLEVTVPDSFIINGSEYKTKIGNSPASLSSSADYMFENNKDIKIVRFEDNIDFSDATNLSCMFYGCTSLEEVDLSNVDTNNATQMCYMFGGCTSLKKVNLIGLDTSSVINMQNMFWKCTSLTILDLTGFNTGKVTNMSGMFMDCSAITSLDLSSFDTANVTNMNNMFRRSYLLNAIYATQNKWIDEQASKTDMFTDCGTSSVTYK